MDEFKNKSDDDLVSSSEHINLIRSRSATVEMMRRLKKSINFSSCIMIILNIFLLIMTGTLIWFAKIQVVPILNEQTKTNQQLLKECKVIYPDNPDYEVTMADGTKMKCSEFIKKFGE